MTFFPAVLVTHEKTYGQKGPISEKHKISQIAKTMEMCEQGHYTGKFEWSILI